MKMNVFGEKKAVSEDEEIRNQVENYHSLKITKSSRGIAVIVIGIFILITLVLYYFDAVPAETLWGILLYIIFAYFIFKGHRWAIIATMIMWTLDKGYQVFTGQGAGIAILFWWLALMSPLYSALKIENARRKKDSIVKIENDIVSIPAAQALAGNSKFCSSCGTRLQTGASFCQNCGNKII